MSRIAAVLSSLILLIAPASAAEPAVREAAGAPATARAQTDVRSAVERLLTASGPEAFALPAGERAAVGEFYAARGFSPLWLWEGGLNQRARRLLDALAAADADGLRSAEYLPASLVSFTDDGAALAADRERAARLDLEITRSALAYARHASGGRIDPATLGRYIAVIPRTMDPTDALADLASTTRPDLYLARLLPRTSDYALLRSALAKYRALAGRAAADEIPEGRLIRPGDRDERVLLIRRRLLELGAFALKVSQDDSNQVDNHASAEAALVSPRYEDSLVQALRKFQKSRGLASDGVIGSSTISALNRSYRHEVDALLINMERMRWLPRDLGRRHILVNQAAFRLRLYDDSEIVHSANVVVGKPGHSTPVFSEEMEHIVFNPYWNVPRSIATREMLPQLAQDPAYFARHGYEVFAMDGRKVQRVDSTVVDWQQADARSFSYQIRQPPGRSNALGRLKFMFPNRFNVYLHDTPSKSLFARESRAFSHGCVRLQNPQRLAEILLGWDKGWSAHKVGALLDSGRNQAIFFDNKIPIHLTYFTAWVNDGGEVAFLDDVYGRDPALIRALVEFRVAMK